MVFINNLICVTLLLISSGSYKVNTTETGDTLQDDFDRVSRVITMGIIGLHYCQKITAIENIPEQN